MSAPIDNPPAEKPVKEAPPVPSGPVDKRIYIGGLHPSTTEDQIVERFSKFGQVSNVTIAKNTDSKCIESPCIRWVVAHDAIRRVSRICTHDHSHRAQEMGYM